MRNSLSLQDIFFSSGCSQYFVFTFQIYIVMICLSINLLEVLPFGVYVAAPNCRFKFLAIFWKFKDIVSWWFPVLLSFSSLSGTLMSQMLDLCCKPSRSPRLHSLFSGVFALCSLRIISYLSGHWLFPLSCPPYCWAHLLNFFVVIIVLFGSKFYWAFLYILYFFAKSICFFAEIFLLFSCVFIIVC